MRHIVDASLDSVYSVNYAPYGELWNAQGTSPMPFGFTGEWQDPNDLLFLRARYYNPAQAAFLSLDPLEGGVGNVRALNRFAYVVADPINLVDPSGTIGEGCTLINQLQSSTSRVGTTPRQKCQAMNGSNTDQSTWTGSVVVNYLGNQAADEAVRLAVDARQRNLVNGLDESEIAGVAGTNSGRFISLSLAAGNFPMTNDGNLANGPADSNPSGWRIGCSGSKPNFAAQASYTHDWLVQYITGTGYGGGSIPEFVASNEVLTVNGTDLFKGFAFNADAPPGISTSVDMNTITDAMKTLRDSGIGIGDYVWGRFQRGGGSHGFIIVGTGAALPCDDSRLDFITDRHRLPRISPTGTAVFYVADLYSGQRGTPRPFYCPLLYDPLGLRHFFDDESPLELGLMARLTFVKIPQQITVPCNRIYEEGIFNGCK